MKAITTETPSQYQDKGMDWGAMCNTARDIDSAISKFILNEHYMHYSDMLKIILYAINKNLIKKSQNNRYYIDGWRIKDELYTSILVTLNTQPHLIDDRNTVEPNTDSPEISEREKSMVYRFVDHV